MSPKVLLIAHPAKPEALRLAREAERDLAGRAEVVPVQADLDAPLEGLDGATLAVTFGGDGTVLSAARRLGPEPPPVLGVNLGRLGYLASVEPSDMAAALAAALDGAIPESRRMTLAADVWRGGRAVWSGHALNEFLLTANSPGRILRISVSLGGHPLMDLAGDGLLVASPTGSTAHALSAGGPILSPEMRALLVVPVCPHRLSLRPFLAGPDLPIIVRHDGTRPERLAADGRHAADVPAGHEVRVRASSRVFRWLAWQKDPLATLRGKLGWNREHA